MTGQFADQVEWRGEPFSIAAVEGTGFFEAGETTPLSTACWRGYVAWYRVDDGRLVLATLETGRAYDGGYLGVPAVATNRGSQEYRNMALPVAFTGRLLVGAGFADIGRLHMGFRPAYGFVRVWELCFDRGRLELAQDRSADLAAVRDRLADTGPGPAPGEDSEDWVRRSFSLSFDYSWPGSPRTLT